MDVLIRRDRRRFQRPGSIAGSVVYCATETLLCEASAIGDCSDGDTVPGGGHRAAVGCCLLEEDERAPRLFRAVADRLVLAWTGRTTRRRSRVRRPSLAESISGWTIVARRRVSGP